MKCRDRASRIINHHGSIKAVGWFGNTITGARRGSAITEGTIAFRAVAVEDDGTGNSGIGGRILSRFGCWRRWMFGW
jgi:hypothetical protein